MTIFEAQTILGFDESDPVSLLDLRHIRKRIEAERETAKGNAKRRKTIELKACDKLIEHLTPRWY